MTGKCEMRFGFLLLGSIAIMNAKAETADTIFLNGNIYTVNEKQPHAEAVAVKNQRILSVGSNREAEQFRGNKTKVVDLAGKTVVPGLTDSHCHIFGIGERELTLNLEGANTLEDFIEKVREGRENGSPAAAGSRLFGSRPNFPRAPISTKSLRTILCF